MGDKTKYLIFTIEEENYAVPINKVQEVIQFIPITPLHETNNYLKGVINLRGRIIPVIDMRLKFGLQEKQYDERTIFIIVEVIGTRDVHNIGLAVDKVQDVVEVGSDAIEKTPDIGFKSRNKYLYGIIQINNQMVMILNMDSILSTEDVIELKENVEN
ncbi:MAG TPA: chemotaxis protein CheW [Exilispira sp.]|jgi:purine-binding chemotaxis protein CheW|nr:purine-binding chemotaxis protein CheW [Caldisericia bacterium]HNV43718.1 chemotaxis protein CheW [Exilispira sp.]HPO61189.1 chemotaxis protein CheW [Exilispira sp.]